MSPDKSISIGFFCYSVYNRGGDRLTVAYANHLASVGHDVTLHVTELDTVFDLTPALKVVFVDCPNRAGFLWYAMTHKLGHDVVIVNIIHLHMLMSLRNNVVYYAQADDIEYYDSTVMRTLIDILYRIYFRSAKPDDFHVTAPDGHFHPEIFSKEHTHDQNGNRPRFILSRT